MIEKLGVEKKQLIEELQSEYNRLRLQEHELQKTSAAAPQRAQLANEIVQIRQRLDSLQAE